MGQKGFSLVELLVIIGIMTILASIATMNFSQRSKKSNVDKQVRTLYTDLLQVRNEALLRKRLRAVKISASSFSTYSSANAAVSPVRQVSFSSGMTPAGPTTVIFDTMGMATDTGGAPLLNQCFCVDPDTTSSGPDSIIINSSQILLGNREGACARASVNAI